MPTKAPTYNVYYARTCAEEAAIAAGMRKDPNEAGPHLMSDPELCRRIMAKGAARGLCLTISFSIWAEIRRTRVFSVLRDLSWY